MTPQEAKTAPNGVFVFTHDLEFTKHSSELDTFVKTFPFYLFGKRSDITRSIIPKAFAFYLYGKWSEPSDITRSSVPKTSPFYAYGKGSESSDITRSTILKTFAFYLYGKGRGLTRSKDTIPNGNFFFEHAT